MLKILMDPEMVVVPFFNVARIQHDGLGDYCGALNPEVKAWLDENVANWVWHDGWQLPSFRMDIDGLNNLRCTFLFDTDKDAMLFKMRWG